MAVRYIGIANDNPQILDGTVIGAASGGTLGGSQVVQVVFDDSVFTSSPEGKQRLLAAIDYIYRRVEAAKTWPIDSTS